MATTNQTGLATPPTTPPALTKAQKLDNILSLATKFSTCVEAFNLIHPSKDSSHAQKVALAKLGIQQGRLLIFGDAVGISSPPPTIAKHMVPSRPGVTNPDPSLPVNFGVRDPELDDAATNEKVRAALTEIAGRPAHLSRDELMGKYGLKAPKRLGSIEYPALDTNRLEAFREKYGLLQDLVKQSGSKSNVRRGMSITMTHWTVQDTEKFDEFVKTVRYEVDGLIELMGVKEQVDRGMKTDIRSMGWHPDLNGPVIRQDWDKLRRIKEACQDDYPEYVQVTETALNYITEELKGTGLGNLKEAYAVSRGKSEEEGSEKPNSNVPPSPKTDKPPNKEKRPGLLSHFKLKSWNKSSKGRSKSIDASASANQDSKDPPRSLSADPTHTSDSSDAKALEPARSKSLSDLPDESAPLNLDSRLREPTEDNVRPSQNVESEKTHAKEDADPVELNGLEHTETASTVDDPAPLEQATTTKSLVDRHDMYKGVGRIATKDVRDKAHEAA